MSDRPSLQDLVEVQNYFDLPNPALVEKDWHVARVLAAIAATDAAPFQLIFAGGTALARAHKLVRRMSEDVDFKIVLANGMPLSQSARQRRLSRLRDHITQALLAAGFRFDPTDPEQVRAQDSSQYAIYHLADDAVAGPVSPWRRAGGSNTP